nr:immunoglobulin heavy chain junction region [Macaca mulatta]
CARHRTFAWSWNDYFDFW